MLEGDGGLVLPVAPPTNGIATAPGDLPMPDVLERFASQRDQFRHDNTIVPLAPAPDRPVEVWATTGEVVRLDHAALFYSTDGSVPGLEHPSLPMEIATVDWDVRTGFLTRWRAVVPALPVGTRVRYRIAGWTTTGAQEEQGPDMWAHDGQGYWFRYPGERGTTTFAYRVEPPHAPLPSWMDETVIYHIFLDRFHPGTTDGAFVPEREPRERHGGTLRGVRRALPYLDDLGVTCLWLSPLHPSETYHRYDGTDFFEVDPDLGTKEELGELVREAHARGMRLILDFVPSHCSWHHPAFEAARNDRSAPTASWFTFDDWPHRYRCFMQTSRNLPSFNTDDPGARSYLVDSAVYWLQECGVDGYRLDHAIAPSMDFWVAFLQAVERARPDAVTIGEATDTPDSLCRFRGKLHGILDFPLARALRLTFGSGAWDVGHLDTFLSAYERYMADGPGRVSFLDNHDMERFLFVAGGDVARLRLAALCQLSLSATPAIYYGTEVGLTHTRSFSSLGRGGDVEARGDMQWDEARWNGDLLRFYRSLIHLRRERPAMRAGIRRTVHLDAAAGTYAYVLSSSATGRPELSDVLVAFNLGSKRAVLSVPTGQDPLTPLLTAGEGVAMDGAEIILPPGTGVLAGVE